MMFRSMADLLGDTAIREGAAYVRVREWQIREY
jgi:hypothetical protein